MPGRRKTSHKRHAPTFIGAHAPSIDRPFRDRSVSVKDSVPCPTCDAEIGEHCVTSKGTETGNHPTRRRMALRKERETSDG
jgi:hypothetical protein